MADTLSYVHRFYVPANSFQDGRALLPASAAEQVRRVLRLRTGDAITIFDGSGREWLAQIEAISQQAVITRPGPESRPDAELPIAITVCQGMVKAERFELVLQKATELGVASIVPLITKRVQNADAAPPSKARLERWQRIVQEAAEQSGRVRLPEIAPAANFQEAVASEAAMGPVVVLWEGGPETGLRAALRAVAVKGVPKRMALVIGPVGGLAPEEVEGAKAIGAVVAGMGARILRSETAAIAALTATVYEFGLLGG